MKYRGHHEDIDDDSWEFSCSFEISFLLLFWSRKICQKSENKNATYLSLGSQNKMIDVITKHTILDDIIQEIKKFHIIQFLLMKWLQATKRFYLFALGMSWKFWNKVRLCWIPWDWMFGRQVYQKNFDRFLWKKRDWFKVVSWWSTLHAIS